MCFLPPAVPLPRPSFAISLLGLRKATRGYPCTENRVGRPKCIHTQMVAAAIWASTGRGEDWVQGTRSTPDDERVDAEERLDEVGTEDAENSDTSGTRRTAKHILSEKGSKYYTLQLRNTLYLMSVYRFPPHFPRSLPPGGVKEPGEGIAKQMLLLRRFVHATE